MAVLVPVLIALRTQLNQTFASRDTDSDGWIGDYAHQAGKSSHNPDDTSHDNADWDNDPDSIQEVRAVDIDVNLNHPYVNAQDLVNWLVKYAKNGTFWWLRYIIYNRKMYHQDNSWVGVTYTGDKPHTAHIHVNSDYSQSSDTASGVNYRLSQLVEEQVPTPYFTSADVDAIWSKDINPGAASNLAYTSLFSIFQNVGSLVTKVDALTTKIDTLTTKVDNLQTHLNTLSGDNAYIKNILDSFTTDYAANEPNTLYDTVVDAIEATH